MTNNDDADWRRDRLALLRKYEILRDSVNSVTDKEIDRALGDKNATRPHGCICPAGAEATCQGALCPRKPLPSRSATA